MPTDAEVQQLQRTVLQPSGAPAFNLTNPNGKYDEVLVGTTAGYMAAAASVAFPNAGGSLPGWGRNLRIAYVARSDAAVAIQQLEIQLNGDTGANYLNANYIRAAGGAAVGVNPVTLTTVPQVASIPGTGSAASIAGSGCISLPFYAGTTFYKDVICTYQVFGAAAEIGVAGTRWIKTVPVSSIKLFPNAGKFIVGSWFGLYIDP